jgi:hypothetical protein
VLQLNLLYIFSLVFFVVQDVAPRLLQQNLVEILLVVVNVAVALDVDDVVEGVDLMDQAYQAFVVVVGVVVVYDALTFVEFVVAEMDQGMHLEATFFVVVVVASEALKMMQHLNLAVVAADAFEMVEEKLAAEVDLMENLVASFVLVDFVLVEFVVVVPQQPLQLFDDVVVAHVAKILLMIVRVAVQEVASVVVELVPWEAVVAAALVELVQDILVKVVALVASSVVDSILVLVVVAHTFVVGMDVVGTYPDVEVVAVHQLQVVEVVVVEDIHLAFLDVVVADMAFFDTFALKDVVGVARTFPLEVAVQVDLPRHFDFLLLMMRRKFVA